MARDEEGAALLIVLFLLLVLVMAGAVVLSAAVTNTVSSTTTAADHAALEDADSAASWFVAETTSDASFVCSAGATSCTSQYTNTTDDPAYGEWDALSGGWWVACTAALSQSEGCVEVSATVATESATLSGVSPWAVLVQVLADSDCQSVSSTGVPQSCLGTARVHERFAQRQFFDYLYFSQYETLDPLLYGSPVLSAAALSHCNAPASVRPGPATPLLSLTVGATTLSDFFCQPVAFTPADVVDGPIHTNDDYYWYCATASGPTFEGAVESTSSWSVTTSDGSVETLPLRPYSTPPPYFSVGGELLANGPGCSSSGVPLLAGSGVFDPDAPDYAIPTGTALSELESIAASDHAQTNVFSPSTATPNDPVTFDLGGPASGSYSVTHASSVASSASWPDHGVLYVNGSAAVYGSVCYPLTIAATGNIYVIGSTTYTSSCSGASLGLVAGGSVVVDPSDYGALTGAPNPYVTATTPPELIVPATPTEPALTLDAAVLALGCDETGSAGCASVGLTSCPRGYGLAALTERPCGGSFYAAVSGLSSTSTTAPVFSFDGSVAEYFRGAFGQFADATGIVKTGYVKRFSFDSHLVVAQPPWFLAPVGAGWVPVGAAATGAAA